ncbi:hypothetical protein Q3G72_020882 [Acer saccharum]|nr:hypothetical protein Q3G72_020882 [Acer saccharum]
MRRFNILGRLEREAAFTAQVLHESNGLRTFVENLNYSVAGLRATWPTRFDAVTAEKLGRSGAHAADQPGIANLAYGGRMGNGSPSTGDGWKYRGRGPLQVTGKANYAACGAALHLDLVAAPDMLLNPLEGCMAAGWYWDSGNPTGTSLNVLADVSNIDRISKFVNGGAIGSNARASLFQQALLVLA